MDKAALREKLNSEPIDLDALQKDGLMAAKALAESEMFKNASAVACFMSLRSETDTMPINKLILSCGKRLLLPRVISREEMAFFEMHDFEHMQKGSFGILEPAFTEPFPAQRIDLMIVPALALTKQGVRLGKGGGYYDRYLAGTHIQTIAIMNKKRLICGILKENHDVLVNYYIVNGKLYPCGGNNTL